MRVYSEYSQFMETKSWSGQLRDGSKLKVDDWWYPQTVLLDQTQVFYRNVHSDSVVTRHCSCVPVGIQVCSFHAVLSIHMSRT